jgi:hypothetical protein
LKIKFQRRDLVLGAASDRKISHKIAGGKVGLKSFEEKHSAYISITLLVSAMRTSKTKE